MEMPTLTFCEITTCNAYYFMLSIRVIPVHMSNLFFSSRVYSNATGKIAREAQGEEKLCVKFVR